MEYPSLDTPTAGAFRFNTDSSQLEIYDGLSWYGIEATSPEMQTGGTRGVYSEGYGMPSGEVNSIEYINVNTAGNAQDFGDLTQARNMSSAVSSRTRWVCWNGEASGGKNTIDYVTFTSTGNATDFGDGINTKWAGTGMSSSTRGVNASGRNPGEINSISYLTIASTGNALDFGDLVYTASEPGGCSSTTRGIIEGGGVPN